MRIKWKPLFFSLFFFVFKHIPLVESDPNFMGGDRSEFRPIVSENIKLTIFLREGERKRERKRERLGRKKYCLHKIVGCFQSA